MSHPYRITALVGSTNEKSRTKVLINAIVKALVAQAVGVLRHRVPGAAWLRHAA